MTDSIWSTSARSRNAQGLSVNAQDDNRRRNIQEYHNVLSPSKTYGEMNSFIDCIMSIAKAGIKRAFPRCKSYVKQVIQFCLSPNGKKMYAKECWRVSMSIGIAIDECHTLAKTVTELCRTLVPPKQSISRPSYHRVTAGKTSAQIQGHLHRAEDYNPKSRTPGALVEVHTLPIGQGDCTVIYCRGGQHAILFDCGKKGGNNTLEPRFIRSYFEGVSSITVMISHGDEDHYNKIPQVFDLNTDKDKILVNKIKEVIFGGPETDYSNSTIDKWLNKTKKPVEYQYDSTKVHKYNFCENDINFEVVVGNPSKKRKDLKNERGMVMKMSCKSCKSSLLFPGDMKGTAARDMARRSKDTNDTFFGILNATHCKMAHHGARAEANEMDWLEAISPIEVIVSHMYNGSRYGHPRCEVIKRFLSLGTTALLKDNVHKFDCIIQTKGVNNTRVNHVVHLRTQYRIYSTAPTSDENCVIVLLFRKNQEATTDIYCGKYFHNAMDTTD